MESKAKKKFGMKKFKFVIPEDVTLQGILPKLPVKSLVRFKSVSKSWNMFSDPIVAAHMRRLSLTQHCVIRPLSSPASLLVGDDDDREPLLVDMEIPLKEEFVDVAGSSNGLILLRSNSKSLLHAQSSSSSSPYWLWNPFTKQHWRLSSPPPVENCVKRIHMGFGFHPQINDYKLVQVLVLKSGELKAHVLALSSGSWKLIEEVPPFKTNHLRNMHTGQFEDSVCVNGVLYNIVFNDLLHDFIVLSFDLRDEVFRTFGFPPYRSYINDLMVYDELLALFETNGDWCHIWTRKNESWRRTLTIGPFPYEMKGLRTWRNTQFLMTNERAHDELFLYDASTKGVRKILANQHILGVHNYVESLVSVHPPFLLHI